MHSQTKNGKMVSAMTSAIEERAPKPQLLGGAGARAALTHYPAVGQAMHDDSACGSAHELLDGGLDHLRGATALLGLITDLIILSASNACPIPLATERSLLRFLCHPGTVCCRDNAS